MRADQNVWNTKVGDIVKVYMTSFRVESRTSVCKWIIGVVESEEFGRAVVVPIKEDFARYDRYLEKENVVFKKGFDMEDVLKSRKILTEKKD